MTMIDNMGLPESMAINTDQISGNQIWINEDLCQPIAQNNLINRKPQNWIGIGH